jgi:hypothetical protein
MEEWRMKDRVRIALAVFVLFAVGTHAADKAELNFDKDEAGKPTPSLSTEKGEWVVVADDTAPSKPNVLAQRAKNERPVYNVALCAQPQLKDVDISVRFRSVAGEIDQGGGLVWRAKDAKNYYIVRFNPIEDNLRVYKVVDGKRSQLGDTKLSLPAGWHTLRVTMTGKHIECFCDGQKHLAADDETFAEPGRVGLWTKADAQTHFDDLTIAPAKNE